MGITFVIVLCAMSYGIYLLLGDCFTSMILALISSQYLQKLKLKIAKIIENHLNGEIPIWHKAYLMKFFHKCT